MRQIRVMVVDDSAVVRRLVSQVIESDLDLELLTTAPNGRIALAKIAHTLPDIVTLDVEMPEMDGLETLRAIRRDHPKLPVIMLSSMTARGAVTTLDALSAGASDYVTKPAAKSIDAASAELRETLLPKIKALGSALAGLDIPKLVPSVKTVSERRRRVAPRPPTLQAVVIGVSTGGPQALGELLPALGWDFPVPVLIVQHMPPTFTQYLADRLDRQCKQRVREAVPGATAEAGDIWFAPGDYHMEVQRIEGEAIIKTGQGPPENSCRPSVDVLFRSAAMAFGSGVLAVILSGMGRDGFKGCEMIRSVDGQVLAQDEASSVVWGMPGFVAGAGIADEVLPLSRMASEIEQRVWRGRRRTRTRATRRL